MALQPAEADIEVPGEAAFCIIETPVRINLGSLVIYKMRFLTDMNEARIHNLILKAAEAAQQAVLRFSMTETSAIVFFPAFPEFTDVVDLYGSRKAKELAERMMAQGWAGLLVTPWVRWGVRCVWHMGLETALPEEFRNLLMGQASDPFSMVSGSMFIMLAFDPDRASPAEDEAAEQFRRQYPEYLASRLPGCLLEFQP